MTLPETPSQTIGPFFSIGLGLPDDAYVVPQDTPGAFWIRGRVLDGAGDPVSDALVETWQADEHGRFAHPDDPRGSVEWKAFRGFGRSPTDADGWFGIFTVKPGGVPDCEGRLQAPHVAVSVFARGLLDRLLTRIYFAPEALQHDEDPLLASLKAEPRRGTLFAERRGDHYRFDIRLQGEHETIFYAL
jgi:protocatechuate 3,4-dioxygenase alpha subunit